MYHTRPTLMGPRLHVYGYEDSISMEMWRCGDDRISCVFPDVWLTCLLYNASQTGHLDRTRSAAEIRGDYLAVPATPSIPWQPSLHIRVQMGPRNQPVL